MGGKSGAARSRATAHDEDLLGAGVAELLTIRQRACHDLHTIEDQQRIQWLSQATFGALDIYQHGVSICAVNREEILEEIDDCLANQHDNLAASLFAPLITGD